MRPIVPIVILTIFLGSLFGAPISVAQDRPNDEASEDPEMSDDGTSTATDRNATDEPKEDGNETGGGSGGDRTGDDAQRSNGSARDSPDRERAADERADRRAELDERRQAERDRRQGQADDRRDAQEERLKQWREAQRSAQQERDDRLRDRLPDHERDRLGGFGPEHGRIAGHFVSFEADADAGTLHDISAGDIVLFESITLPGGADHARAAIVSGADEKSLHVRGEDWRFRITDAPAVPLLFASTTEDATFILMLPEGAEIVPFDAGIRILYASGVQGRIMGDVEQGGGTEPGNESAIADATGSSLIIGGDARFFVAAERVVLEKVANKLRPQLEAALEARTLGAEAVMLRDNRGDAVSDLVLYEDMDVEISEGTAVADGGAPDAGVFTITVDAEAHEGKTIAVSFETGLLDPDALTFRYFNVDEDRTVEAAIAPADSINDVLEPTDDGTVAEYWVVTDADGTQVLVSIPHFSVHKIEIQSLVDVVIEQPSLVLGFVGALLIVAVATGAMFRRPGDDA